MQENLESLVFHVNPVLNKNIVVFFVVEKVHILILDFIQNGTNIKIKWNSTKNCMQ